MLRHRAVWYIDERNVFYSIFKVKGESSNFLPSSHTVPHPQGPTFGKPLIESSILTFCVCEFFFSQMHATCLIHLTLLEFITLT